jgi:hypothetical protein
MFTSGNQFGGPIDPHGGPFSAGGPSFPIGGGAGFGGGGGDIGGPPGADDMFEGMGDGDMEDLYSIEEFIPRRRAADAHAFLQIGLHFFEKFKRP